MASLGCRAGSSLLSKLYRLGRQGRSAPHLARLLLAEGQVNQIAVRQLAVSSCKPIQAQPVKIDENHEQEEASIPVSRSKARLAETLDKMLYKLDIEVRRTGRAHHFDLQKIVDLVAKEKFCTNTQALLLLRCCGDLLTDESKETRRQRVDHLVETLKPIVKLDVSHYNALLKIHIENENKIVASDFLAEMEKNGVQPNRVTFQHLIGMYCMDGNIVGATTILEHMKQEDMAINETVFHSLLMGHCLNRDKESVDATLEVMENSGLMPGAETYTTILCSYAKARDWNKVEEVLVEARSRDVQLDDGDYFKIIIALCQNKMEGQAQALVSKLPRKTGYFLEMRSALPQILYSGCYQLAFDIFLNFRLNSQTAKKQDLSTQGFFMVRALVRSGADIDTCIHHIGRMVDAGYTEAPTRLIESAVEHRNDEFCEELGKAVTKAFGEAALFALDTNAFLRKQISGKLADNEEEIFAILRKLQAVGIKIPYINLSLDIINKLLDVTTMNPSDLLNRIRASVPSLSWGFLCNSLLRSLLSKEKMDHFVATVGFLLNVNQTVFYPDWWRVCLARTYLLNPNIDHLTTVLFVVSRKLAKTPKDGEKDHMRNLFSFLIEVDKYQASLAPEKSSLDIIKPIVTELIKQRIGVPRSVAEELDTLLKNAELKDLLEDAVKEFESDFWTPQLEEEFLTVRRELYKEAAREAGFSLHKRATNQQYKGYFEIPDSLKEMLKIKEMLKRRNEQNNRLTDKLIKAYADQDQPEKALAELQEARDASQFSCSPNNSDHVIQSFIRTGNLEGAVAFYRDMMANSGNIYANSFVSVLLAYAQKGDLDTLMDLIKTDGGLKFINTTNSFSFMPILDFFAEKGDADNLKKVFTALFSQRPLMRESLVYTPLIQVHLVRHDLPAAVAEFERVCLDYRKLPLKFELTAKLIEAEDVEAMQRVLDLSIGLIGEEKSLYDLAYNFLDQGRRAQSKKLLETPGLRYNHAKMTYIMARLAGKKNYEALEDLVLLSKNVFGCDRDFMFLTWVKTVAHDASKVSDIWLNIQEEGHAPSDTLKAEIARCLQAGGLSVPFVYTPEKSTPKAESLLSPKAAAAKIPQGGDTTEATDKEAVTRRKRTSKEASKTASTPAAERATEPDSLIERALDNGDLNALVEAIQNNHAKEKIDAIRRGLNSLNEARRYSDVANLVEAMNYKPRFLKGTLRASLNGLLQNGQYEVVRDYVKRIPDSLARIVKTDGFLRTTEMLMDTEGFVSRLETVEVDEGAEKKNWLTDPRTLLTVFQVKENLEERLEKLATGGCLPANVLLGRLACFQGNKDKFMKHWDHDTRENRRSVARDMVVDIDTIDRLRWVSETLREAKAPLDVVDVAANMCLSKVKTDQELLEVMKIGEASGVALDKINTTSLNRLINLPSFAHKEAARSILEKRSKFGDTSS